MSNVKNEIYINLLYKLLERNNHLRKQNNKHAYTYRENHRDKFNLYMREQYKLKMVFIREARLFNNISCY